MPVRRVCGRDRRCAPPVPRAAWSGRPASSATTCRWPRSNRSTSRSRPCGRAAPCRTQRVEMTQHGRPVLDAMVWSVGDVAGLEHEDTVAPDVPAPTAPTREELWPDAPRSDYAFWDNFEQRMLEWSETWPPPAPLPPTWQAWVRPRPTATFDDPWVDAADADRPGRGELAGRGRARTCTSNRPLLRRVSTSTRFPVPGQRFGMDAHRRPLAGGTGWAFVVDQPDLVKGSSPDRQRRGAGGLPSHLTRRVAPGPLFGPQPVSL